VDSHDRQRREEYAIVFTQASTPGIVESPRLGHACALSFRLIGLLPCLLGVGLLRDGWILLGLSG
jgi:hypothetical protein